MHRARSADLFPTEEPLARAQQTHVAPLLARYIRENLLT